MVFQKKYDKNWGFNSLQKEKTFLHLLTRTTLLVLLIFMHCRVFSAGGFDWWNQLHGWKPGDPHWRQWMTISPAFLGPNALPVPEIRKGILSPNTEIEMICSNHFLTGDNTQDIAGRFYFPFAQNRIAFEVYAVGLEHYANSMQIRNERFSRDKDGKGYAVGDFYVTTLIQLTKGPRLPNTLLRFSAKTASGNLDAARYSDTPGYYFDLSFSKDFKSSSSLIFRPFAMYGFYCWQTYEMSNPQNDAYLYGIGADAEYSGWLLSGSLSGYSGYKNNGDKPQVANFDCRKELGKYALRFQYNHGIRDWKYKTIRLSFILKLKSIR